MDTDKKRIPLSAVFFVLGLLSTVRLDAGETQSLDESGLEIEVTETKREFDRFGHFKIEIENDSDGPRTLSAKIELMDQGRTLGECLVYMESPAGGEQEQNVLCMGTAGYSEWKLSIVKIYEFIPKGK